jgi:peptidoglycan hydrolase-like protein with peptidoglycan-binding domain
VGYADSVIGEVQLRLARGGYYHGAIDGVSGSETRRAIRAYEHAHALPQDGRIGQRLLTTMGLS